MTVWPNGSPSRPSISSNYGKRAPIKTKAGTTSAFHTGTDFVGFKDVYSVEPGVVEYAAFNAANGNEVRIRHGNGALSRYYHLAAGLLVSAGQKIDERVKIGEVGDTGMATGKHLHFRIDIHGAHVDPLAYMAGRFAVVPEPANPAPAGVAALTARDVQGFGFRRVKGDGITYWEPTGTLARRIQQGLKNAGVYSDKVDGVWGKNTRAGVQKLLKSRGLYAGRIDSLLGINNAKGIQTVARGGGYTGIIDGVLAEYSWVGFARALGV